MLQNLLPKSAGLSPAIYKRARTIIEKGTEEQKQKLISGSDNKIIDSSQMLDK